MAGGQFVFQSSVCSSRRFIFDDVVVGSGLSGLACARVLARAGRRVAVLEANPELGGHLRPFTRGHALFEVGLHYLADTGAGSQWERALQQLGIELTYRALGNPFEVVEGVGNYPSNFDQWKSEMLLRFSQHQAGILEFCAIANFVWTIASKVPLPLSYRDLLFCEPDFRSIVQREFGNCFAVGGSPSIGVMFRGVLLGVQNWSQFLKGFRFPDAMVEMLSIQNLLLGCPPKEMSALVHLIVFRYYFEKPCFPEGGGRVLLAKLMHEDVDYRVSEMVVKIEKRESSF